MTRREAVVDTNVVVSGLITADRSSPPSRIVVGMLRGRFPYVLSVELLSEYRRVLLREVIRARHGLAAEQVDIVLKDFAANAIVRPGDPSAAVPEAPDPGDQFLWNLLAAVPDALLVTGDGRLLDDPPPRRVVISPAAFVEAQACGGVTRVHRADHLA